jgi:ABC-2 type transport system ATP-binding protein
MNLLATDESIRQGSSGAVVVDPIVELENLTKRYPVRRRLPDVLLHPRRGGYVTAVDTVSWTIGRGEFFGLLGPNGAGKTTIFKMLSTLVTPDKGNARVGGFDLMRHPARVRSIVGPVIADERSLNWRISAYENLRLYATLHGLRGVDRERRVRELLDVVGLEGTGYQLVGSFSTGMKQRLLLARALLAYPAVLLLDEPTRSLDPVAARQFRKFLREDIVGEQGCTVLLATHNTEEALELCDRLAVLDKGRLVALGTPDELSSNLTGQRYRIVSLGSLDATVSILERHNGALRIVRSKETDGDPAVEVEIDGTEELAAQLLTALVMNGVEVARFEKVRLPLADLIERLVRGEAE